MWTVSISHHCRADNELRNKKARCIIKRLTTSIFLTNERRSCLRKRYPVTASCWRRYRFCGRSFMSCRNAASWIKRSSRPSSKPLLSRTARAATRIIWRMQCTQSASTNWIRRSSPWHDAADPAAYATHTAATNARARVRDPAPDRAEPPALCRGAGEHRVQRLFPGQGSTHHRCADHPDRSVCAEALPMIAQLLLTALLTLVLVYAWSAHRTVPIIGLLASGAALAGLYFLWVQQHATALASLVGIGPGYDLIA